MFHYVAYGLAIDSELELPELSSRRNDKPDATIRFGEVTDFRPNVANRNHHATPEEFLLNYPDVGKFHVRQGAEIVVDLESGAYSNLLRVCLLGPVMAALLHQRGLLVLHGSAINIDGNAVAFLGDKGWGKSTLAAFMQARGHRFISDDVLPVSIVSSQNIQLIPGFPQIKLWPDSVEYLGMQSENMSLLQPDLDKRGLLLDRGFCENQASLAAIYVLDIDEREEITRIEPRQALIELVRHSYLVRYLQRTSTSMTHLRQCREVLSTVPAYYLKRRPSLLQLNETAELVEKAILQYNLKITA
jgi:hypothetical protein